MEKVYAPPVQDRSASALMPDQVNKPVGKTVQDGDPVFVANLQCRRRATLLESATPVRHKDVSVSTVIRAYKSAKTRACVGGNVAV